MKTKDVFLRAVLPFVAVVLATLLTQGQTVDLLKRYPTQLTAGDAAPERARPWEFTSGDIYRLSRFRLAVGQGLRVETGAADLGIGHGTDGAVWAIVLPREGGKLTSSAAGQPESIAHVWLRLHPKEIGRLFPSDTVFGDGAGQLAAQMRVIASTKFSSSWHAGMNAMIPEPKDLTVDVDVAGGPRRFFVADMEAQTAKYIAAFESRFVKPPPEITAARAQEAFDKLWGAFDRDYAMFVLRPEVDWQKLREVHRPRALGAKSAYEFAEVCAEMLKPLRDLHIWLRVAGAEVPVFNRPRSANSNPAAHGVLLGKLQQAGPRVAWAVTADKIGYLVIHGWDHPAIPAQCDEVLEEMRDTRGLIVDVRLNGGGSEDQAQQVAGRFLAKRFVYAYSQFRNGPQYTNLTEKLERSVMPRGPWRYNRPVVLLIGQKCMSSNESFVAMMSGDPDLITLGDHTCGSSGNPRLVALPLGMTVSVPRWIDFLPDGTPLDERGFRPQVQFEAAPGAFEGRRDDLLSAALERLRQVRLSEKPIEGPAAGSLEASEPEPLRRSAEGLPDHRAEVKEEAQDATRPRVVSVMPAAEAQEVPLVTELRVRFERPMDPLALKLTWESGGFLDCEAPRYDTNRYEFTIPVRLAGGALHQVVVNSPFIEQKLSEARKQWPLDGFQSAEHRLAGLYVWRFRTRSAPTPADSKVPKVRAIVPAPGSEVAQLTIAEIQFDQPMAPPEEAAPYVISPPGVEGPKLISKVSYDAASRTFRLPLVIKAKQPMRFTVAGWRSAAGVAAEPVRLDYRASGEERCPADRARSEAAAKEPRLLEVLAAMRQQRLELRALAERVQTLWLRQDKGVFTSLEAKSAVFKWQKPDRFYADVSQPMLSCRGFRIGCDGQNWWWDMGDKLTVCPASEMHILNVCLSDPFELTSKTPAAAAADWRLAYTGLRKNGEAEHQVIEAWSTSELTQYWFEPGTARLAEIRAYSIYGVWRQRFLYEAVNQPLAAEVFAVPRVEGVEASPVESLDADYTRRFVNVRDGSDGRMSVRWGKMGPKGRSSSGLN